VSDTVSYALLQDIVELSAELDMECPLQEYLDDYDEIIDHEGG